MNEIKYRKLTDLVKLENNPRSIDDPEFKDLCESVKKHKSYFEARPLILSDRTGKLVIIAGNQRYDAAAFNKMKEVPTTLLSGLTEDDEREIIIRDNVSAGKWDLDKLSKDWSDLPLKEWGIDLPDVNFGPKEPVEIKQIELTPYKKTHVLLSFPPEKMLEIQDLLEQIKSIPGIEYEQASN